MKKWLLVLVLTLVPTFAVAAEFRSGERQLSLGASETINDDIYTASGTVNIASTINGDLTVAGGTISFDGKVTGDVFGAGGTIILNGEIGDDVRMAGGTLTVNGTINDDLIVTGGEIHIAKDAVVKGQVYLAAGEVVIAGQTGSVKAGVGKLTLEKTAVVNGDLSYHSEQEADISPEATISGVTDHNVVSSTDPRFALAGFGIAAGLIWWLTIFVLAGLLMTVAPNKSDKLAKGWTKGFWTNLLTGFLLIVAAPIAAVILMFTIIGVPLGIGVMILIPVLLFIAELVAVITIGYWIQRLISDKTDRKISWWSVLASAALFTALSLIPFVGWIVQFVIVIASLGALIRYDWSLLKALRHDKRL